MQQALPRPPSMPRRVVQPFRHLALLAGLAAVPIAIVLSGRDDKAQSSVLHVVVSFIVLMLAFRLIGKRELGRLSPFELVTLMLIPEILSNTVQGESSLFQGLAGLCTILMLVLTTSLLSQRFPAVQDAVEASPRVLVSNGVLLERNMNAERIAPEELYSEMRKQGISGIAEVRFAVLESSGNITFIPRNARPHANHDEDNVGVR
jgi:uncharacterized membrane protein YcaP (DUF421 family)